MEQWMKVSLLLCTFGLLKEIRPSEPYVTEFLLGPWRNITKNTLNHEVYPVSTYSYLALLVVVFLICDYFKYKPLIIVSGLSGVAVYVILLWTESLEWLQVSQFFYALYMATEVAYYSYMFAKVDEDKYKLTSSYSRSAALFGRFISGVLGQLFVSFKILDYRQLNYITLASQILATIWALFLPPVKKTIYFHHQDKNISHENISMTKEGHVKDSSLSADPLERFDENKSSNNKNSILLWKHMTSAYKQKSVLAWSLWYASSTAGYYQVQYYIQIIYKEIDPIDGNLYNGVVKAVSTILASGAALTAGLYKFKNQNIYNIFPPCAAGLQAIFLIIVSSTTNIWMCYSFYIAFSITYHFMITITSFQIARHLIYNNCFGLIFGINTLIAIAIQSLLTLIVITVLNLPIRKQYEVYIVYCAFLSITGLIMWFIFFFKIRNQRLQRDFQDENIENEVNTVL